VAPALRTENEGNSLQPLAEERRRVSHDVHARIARLARSQGIGTAVPTVVSRRRRDDMQLSARNQLKGTVKSVKTGAIMAEVVLDVGGNELVAEISKGSVERLQLKTGDQVTAIIKATEVMVGK
jgi:molybdopterin-binding protein